MRFALVVVFAIILQNSLLGQEKPTEFDRIVTFPTKFLQKLNSAANKYEQKLTDNTEKLLKRLQRQEERLKRKLSRKDSISANAVFSHTDSIYRDLASQFQQRNYATNPKDDTYV